MLVESQGFRERLAAEIAGDALHRGLETEKIFAILIESVSAAVDLPEVAKVLDEKDRRILFEVLFESAAESTWEEAESCLAVLRGLPLERELADLERLIRSNPPPQQLRELSVRRIELQKLRRTLGGA
jgi:hypothetical protein